MPGKTKRVKHVPPSVKEAIRGGLKEPQLAEIAAYFFEAAGGTRAVSRLLFDEFTAASPGSMTRQRILDLVLRATKFGNERNKAGGDLGILSEEDLQSMLHEMVNDVGPEQHPGPSSEEAEEPAEGGTG